MIIQSLLMCEQLVVHLPEFFLCSCRFRCFSRTQGMRMSPHGWEVTKNKAQIDAQEAPNVIDHWIGTSAVKALEVAIFHQRHWRTIHPRGVVAIGNRVFESNDFWITHSELSIQEGHDDHA